MPCTGQDVLICFNDEVNVSWRHVSEAADETRAFPSLSQTGDSAGETLGLAFLFGLATPKKQILLNSDLSQHCLYVPLSFVLIALISVHVIIC